MKKLLSMVLALCMLATSMSLVATAENEALKTFKNSKIMYLNKNALADANAVSSNYPSDYVFKIKNGNTWKTSFCWADNQVPNVKSATNVVGNSVSYFDYDGTSKWFLGANNSTGHAVKNVIRNVTETTLEIWVSVDDISGSYKTLFFTCDKNNWSNPINGLWSLYIQDGKLKHTYGTRDAEGKLTTKSALSVDVDFNSNVGKFTHIVVTRKIDIANSKILYNTYVDGVKKGETVERTGAEYTATPDGDNSSGETGFFFMGAYSNNNIFKGKLGEVNVYSSEITSSVATELYNENKDTYSFPKSTEDYLVDLKKSKAVQLNKNATTVNDMFVSPANKNLTSWPSGNQLIKETEFNTSDKSFTSLKITNNAQWYVIGDSGSKQDIYTQALNVTPKVTYEFWLKAEDLGLDSNDRKPLFYTGTGYHFHTQYSQHIKQGFYLERGKLVYKSSDTEVANYDITNNDSQYVHAVLVREVDSTNNKIIYKAYFNGEKKGEYSKSVDSVENPDGSIVSFLGCYADGQTITETHRFSGNIAELNVYHDAPATDEVVDKLYNENKDTYKLPVKVVDPVEAFAKSKKVELNKDANSFGGYTVNPTNNTVLTNWPNGDKWQVVTETNDSGSNFKALSIDNTKAQNFIAADNATTQTLHSRVVNTPKLTYEFWVKSETVGSGEHKLPIFYTGDGWHFYDAFSRDVKQALYIQSGKLVYGIYDNGELVVGQTNVENKQSKYIHVVLSREVNASNNTITYKAYFDGEFAGERVKNVTSEQIAYPDGSSKQTFFYLGGIWNDGTSVTNDMRFKGNIAEFNVYHDFATENIAKTLYEENKDTYLLYTTFEKASHNDGDAMSSDTVSFTFSSSMDESTFATGLEVKKGETVLTYNTDYTAKAEGNDIVITIKNIDFNSSYKFGFKDNLRAKDGAKVDFTKAFEDEEPVFTYRALSIKADSVKTALAGITDFSKNNIAELKALKKEILPLEKLGVDFSGATNYANYCNISENLTKIEKATYSYSDNQLCIDLAFEYPVSESYIEKIKYFEGRKNAEFDIQAVRNSKNEIIGAKITADNTYKSSDYVQVTVDNGWLGQETKNFYIPTAVEIGKVIIKDNQNKNKASLGEITDGIANVSVSAVNNSFANGITGDFVFTVKDTTGKLVDVRTIQKTLDKGETQNVSVKFENIPANAKDYEIEVYFWNGVSAMKPHTEKTDFKKTYGLDNVNDTTKDLKVVAIGGSITEGGNITTPFIKSWDDSREGKINFVNAGIGGTQSNYGSLRLKDDVLSHKPDVVIVEFILNDTGEQTCAWNVENIIRTCYEAEHQPVVMFLYVPDRIKSGENYRQVENFGRYKKVLDAYGLTPLNAHQMAVDTVNAGTNWDTYVSLGDVHPNATQGANIANLMWTELSSNMSTYMKNIAYTDKMYYRNAVENGTRVSASMTTYDENWSEKTPDNLVTEGYGNAATMRSKKYVATKTAGAKMSFEFSGTKLILTTIVGKTGRSADYVIKDENGNIETTGKISNYVNLNPFENLMFDLNATSGDQYMELNLSKGMHTIEITVLDSDNVNSEFGIADILIDEN